MIAENTTKRVEYRNRRPPRYYAGRGLIYGLVIVGSMISMFPFMWTLMSSGKSVWELGVFPPTLFPQEPIFVENYTRLMIEVPFALWVRNSAIVTVLTLIGAIASAAVVAYGFARFEFRGRNILFFILLTTMMLPGEVTLIPQYVIFNWLGWIDSYKPLVVPAYFGGGAFNIFLMRQFFMSIPRDMDESAEIDGAGPLTIFVKILLPLAKPVIATAAALGFIGSWNSFMGPLIYLNSPSKFTATLGLRYFSMGATAATSEIGSLQPMENLLMAASLIVALPCLILFFVAQKYFVQGIVTTGIKG
jgi:multiple sugar transport system permease protein